MSRKTGCMSVLDATRFVPPMNAVLVAIRDPGLDHPKYQLGWKEILKLNFWDDNRIPMAVSLDIWTFIDKHRDKDIFAHCEAGISRSAAVKEFLLRMGWTDVIFFGLKTFPNSILLSDLERRQREANANRKV